jgi:hypothetical protein
MEGLENILHACRTIGEGIYEQNQKLVNGKLIQQERIKVDLSSMLDELVISQIHNLCNSYNLKCQLIAIDVDVHLHFQLQLYQK